MDLWRELSVATKLRIIGQVLSERATYFRKKYPAVTGMSAGYRVTRSQNLPHMDEVCLRFTVRAKWAQGVPKGRLLPASVSRTVSVNNRRMKIRIPTDVSAYQEGRQQSTDLTNGIEIDFGAVGPNYGVSLCIVSDVDAPDNKFLLTCQHVVDPRLSGEFDNNICVNSANLALLGICNKALGAMLTLDAALIPLRSGAFGRISSWRTLISSVVGHSEIHDLMNRHETLFLLCRSRTPSTATLAAVSRTRKIEVRLESVDHDNETLKYVGTNRSEYSFNRLIKYYFLSEPSKPGDSGSAVVTADGRLVGMHFYGMIENNSRSLGFAIEASALFQNGLFPINISLP